MLKLVAGAVIQTGRINFVALGGTRPARFGQHHRDRLGRHQFFLFQGLCRIPLNQDRSSVISVCLGVCDQFLFDQGFHARFRAKDGFQTGALIREQALFVANFHLFQFREMT